MSIEKKKSSVLQIYGYIALAIWALSFFSKYLIKGKLSDLIWVLVPTLWIGFTMLAGKMVQRFVAERVEEVWQSVVIRLRWGIGIFFFFCLMPSSGNANLISLGILVISFIYASFPMLSFMRHYIVWSAVIKAVLYSMTGVLFKWMFYVLWKEGTGDAGFKISISDMLLFGYLTLAACSLISLFQLSENVFLIKISKWSSRSLWKIFLVVCAGILLFKDIGGEINQSISGKYVLTQWLVIFLVLLILLFILLRKIQRIDASPVLNDFKKQVLDVKHIKTNDLQSVSSYIDEFVNQGSKNKILTYLLYLSQQMGISEQAANNLIVQHLLGYEDIPVPVIRFQRELEVINQRNKENRGMVIQNVITKLKEYGGVKK